MLPLMVPIIYLEWYYLYLAGYCLYLAWYYPYLAGYHPYLAGYYPYIAGYYPYFAGYYPTLGGYSCTHSAIAGMVPDDLSVIQRILFGTIIQRITTMKNLYSI
jgi:hypothetical protein